jgi:hypothetical protein
MSEKLKAIEAGELFFHMTPNREPLQGWPAARLARLARS